MEESPYKKANFLKFVQDHLGEDPALLLFKYQGKVDFDLKLAVQQIAAKQKTAKKLPSWTSDPRVVFPASISLEQCSSEITAQEKTKNRSGNLMIDLTGGFGVDFFYLSQNFKKGIYCERQPDLFQIAKQNLEMLSPEKFDFVNGDGLDFLKETRYHFDLLYADPARRGTANQKLYKLQDCEPNVVGEWELMKQKSDQILLKASPMLDISQAWNELPEVQKITVLSVKNDVKELILSWQKGIESIHKEIEVLDLESNYPVFRFQKREEEQASSTYSEVRKYLIEPLSGILKAGAFKLFGERYGLQKLEKNTHLYTSDTLPKDIPGRVFEVLGEIHQPKKELKVRFQEGKVNVLARNFSIGAEELKKKFGLRDGGNDFLIATKTLQSFKIFQCQQTK
jgi:16S rRNA G966 N2-methylase RsmD